MPRVLTVVGARPQFIKAAVISRLVREKYRDRFSETLIHTGQHFDDNMSEVFFRELEIPLPEVNLGIASLTRGRMIGEMLSRIDGIVESGKPDVVLVYGDTNSTLAGALAASARGVPLAHVEAGLRSYNRVMPEETNRVLTDHISDLLFCPSESSRANLAKEGITRGVHVTGDIMYDAHLYYGARSDVASLSAGILERAGIRGPFYLVTLHRAENTDDPERLREIISALNGFAGMPGLFPVHPRTRKALKESGAALADNVVAIEPVGFLEMIGLERRCSFVITDSGGVQKEAYFHRKPCITVRDETEWVETVEVGWNQVVGASSQRIMEAMSAVGKERPYVPLYGDGHSGERILEIMQGIGR